MAETDEKLSQSRYKALIEKIFLDRFRQGVTCVPFERTDIEAAADEMGIKLPKNLGDVIYSVRYRTPMPERIIAAQGERQEWIIEGMGRGKYGFCLVYKNRIVPNPDLVTIKIPDATPEIIAKHALSDEQALLAKVRYNRLVDIFLGVAAYSLQNHLRTTVRGVGQIEIDEIYVAVDKHGRQFVIPVQAKGGTDQLSVVQAKQDILCCKQKFPHLLCRPVSAQFMGDDKIAIFELALEDDRIGVVEEKHYKLVPSSQIHAVDLAAYGLRA